VYPERIPPAHHDCCLYRNDAELLEHLTWAVGHPEEAGAVARELRTTMGAHDWSVLAPHYDRELSRVAATAAEVRAPQ
jgi:hypothetical protein